MSTTDTPVNAYLRTKVMTAPREELRLMLLDGAVKFASQAREGLARKDFESVYNGVTQCRDIIVELMTTVRDDVDPDLAGKVRALYGYLYNELTTANLEKDLAKFDGVINLLAYERETWQLLIQKFRAERSEATAEAASTERPALSVQA